MGTPQKLAAKWCWEMPNHPKESDGQGMPALRAGDGLCRDAHTVCEVVSDMFRPHGDQAVPDLLCGQLT